jgi:hypothetical protein
MKFMIDFFFFFVMKFKGKKKKEVTFENKSYISFAFFFFFLNRCSRKINVRIYILSVRLYSHDRIYHHHCRVVKWKSCITNESIYTHPHMCIIHIEYWSIDSQWKWCKQSRFQLSFSVNVSIPWVIVNSKIMISSNLNVSRRSPFNWGTP